MTTCWKHDKMLDSDSDLDLGVAFWRYGHDGLIMEYIRGLH